MGKNLTDQKIMSNIENRQIVIVAWKSGFLSVPIPESYLFHWLPESYLFHWSRASSPFSSPISQGRQDRRGEDRYERPLGRGEKI